MATLGHYGMFLASGLLIAQGVVQKNGSVAELVLQALHHEASALVRPREAPKTASRLP